MPGSTLEAAGEGCEQGGISRYFNFPPKDAGKPQRCLGCGLHMASCDQVVRVCSANLWVFRQQNPQVDMYNSCKSSGICEKSDR